MSACVTTIRTAKYDSKKLVIFPGKYKQLVEELRVEQPDHLYPQSSARVLFSLRTTLLGHQSLLPSPFYEALLVNRLHPRGTRFMQKDNEDGNILKMV